ncbi:UNVERIFIED_CONTAM: hypothetical protein FKN15_052159 [Acipenser sinensis]
MLWFGRSFRYVAVGNMGLNHLGSPVQSIGLKNVTFKNQHSSFHSLCSVSYCQP